MNGQKSLIISLGAVGVIVMLIVVGVAGARSQQIRTASKPDSAAAASGGQGAMVQQIMLNNANEYGNKVGQTETAEDDLSLDTMNIFTAQ